MPTWRWKWTRITAAELDHIRERVEALGLRTSVTRGEKQAIIGCIGDDDLLREAAILRLPGVESVMPVMKPYKLAAREFVGEPSRIRVGDGASAVVGGRGRGTPVPRTPRQGRTRGRSRRCPPSCRGGVATSAGP